MPYTPKLVRVVWLDTEQDPNWQTLRDTCQAKPPVAVSIGLLLGADTGYLTLASTVCQGEFDRTTIPSGCVQSVEPIRSADDLAALLQLIDEHANSP